jgi:hypothetical protein
VDLQRPGGRNGDVKRLLPLLALALLAGSSPPALGDGCPSPCSRSSVNPPGTTLLAVRPQGDGGTFVAYDMSAGKRRFSLPAGSVSADGRTYVSSYGRARWTRVSRFDTRTGTKRGSWRTNGGWWVAGMSADGHWLVLSRWNGRAHRAVFEIVDAHRWTVIHRVALRGNFQLDGISRDGRRLFLIQYVGRGYRVRAYALGRGLLGPDALKPRGEASKMTGWAAGAIGSPDGRWLLTLYLEPGKNESFVHALDLDHAVAYCIDLPGRGSDSDLSQYSLTLATDGQTLFAANAALGRVAVVDLHTHAVVKTVKFARWRRGTQPQLPLPWAGNGISSHDMRAVYFAGSRTLWAYDARFVRVRGPYRTGGELVGLGFGKGDKRLYALREDGTMLAFDAASGARLR